MNKRRRGFTWVELLVILAMVSFLAAVLSPIFIRRFHNSKRTACQANVRAIALAIKMYLKDSVEHFPTVRSSNTAYGWAGSLQPYLKDVQILQCPSDTTWPDAGDGPKSRNYTDYFYNSNLSGRNESAVGAIASTIILGDAKPGDARRESNGGTNRLRRSDDIQRIVDRNGAAVGAAMRHLDGANYSFADGHVKWLKGSDSDTCPAIRLVPSSATWISFDIN
jgi:prepilin-type processing-associated H-X9-DG protein